MPVILAVIVILIFLEIPQRIFTEIIKFVQGLMLAVKENRVREFLDEWSKDQ